MVFKWVRPDFGDRGPGASDGQFERSRDFLPASWYSFSAPEVSAQSGLGRAFSPAWRRAAQSERDGVLRRRARPCSRPAPRSAASLGGLRDLFSCLFFFFVFL